MMDSRKAQNETAVATHQMRAVAIVAVVALMQREPTASKGIESLGETKTETLKRKKRGVIEHPTSDTRTAVPRRTDHIALVETIKGEIATEIKSRGADRHLRPPSLRQDIA